jgi:3D (Asp-Asp-Asp) domain-containing protein
VAPQANQVPIISQSLWRKGVATAVAAGAFVFLYEVTMLDSQFAARLAMLREATAMPAPGVRLGFAATAYCKGATTTSGVAAQKGVAAADPQLLPVGSVVQIDSADNRYSGIYTIMDTGPLIQGRQIDIYIWNCDEAMRFGRREIRLNVLRLGWNPRATTREADVLPSRPPLPPAENNSPN